MPIAGFSLIKQNGQRVALKATENGDKVEIGLLKNTVGRALRRVNATIIQAAVSLSYTLSFSTYLNIIIIPVIFFVICIS